MHKDEYFGQLLEKWLRNEISPREALDLMNHLEKEQVSRPLLQKLRQEFEEGMHNPAPVPNEISDKVRQALMEKIESAESTLDVAAKGRYRKLLRWTAAAAVVSGLVALSYFLFIDKKDTNTTLAAESQIPAPANDVEAGTSKAVLTLADGTKIELDDEGQKDVLNTGAVKAISRNGELVYESKTDINEVEYNTLSSARGQSYSLVLADGSRLWLNAASSVRFPTAFTGNERSVEITGEVFFDVAHDNAKPFHVKVGETEITVLGTQFNVNAYTDEKFLRTTLVEGSVLVTASDKNLKLEPGQQARYSNNSLNLVRNVNVDEIIAWKEGNFHFENADLGSILRQFSRWYDIEVEYKGELSDRKFFGIISRKSSLANVLKMFDANDISFHIEGKKLTVQPN